MACSGKLGMEEAQPQFRYPELYSKRAGEPGESSNLEIRNQTRALLPKGHV